jgi:DNA mismatch endonuclease, patch repair protein
MPFKKGYIPWNKGIKTGHIPWNKGLTAETDIRIAIYANKQSISKKGHFPIGFKRGQPGVRKNKLHKQSSKDKMSLTKKGIRYSPRTEFKKGHIPPFKGVRGIHLSPTTEFTKETRLNQIIPMKDTKIEIKLQKQLDDVNIIYEKHKSILGQPDIYIPSLNLCIFADGCYWHGCHHCNIGGIGYKGVHNSFYRDFRIKHELELEGYKVMRLWEHDINKPDFNIMNYLNKMV